MNVRSKYEEYDEVKPEKKRYLKLGYGGPNLAGRAGFPVIGSLGNIPSLFDMIFEKLGIKETKRRRSEGDE